MTCGLGAGAQEASAIDIARAAMFLFGDVILSLPLFHPFTRTSWLACTRNASEVRTNWRNPVYFSPVLYITQKECFLGEVEYYCRLFIRPVRWTCYLLSTVRTYREGEIFHCCIKLELSARRDQEDGFTQPLRHAFICNAEFCTESTWLKIL